MKLSYIRRSIFRILKQNKWIFYAFEWIKWHKEIDNQKKVNNPATLKSKEQIKREEKLIKNYWRIGTFHYYRYGLQYKQLTDEQLLDYVPTFFFHKNIEKHHKGIDTIKYGDKLTQARLFEQRAIPTANVIAIYQNNKWFDFNDSLIDFKKLVEDKLSQPTNKLFIKPTGNCGGAGILVLKKNGGNLILNGQNITSIDDLYTSMDKSSTYIVEENIIQSEQLNKINPSSVNTIRVVVQRDGSSMQIRSCILRMGRTGKEVDNSAQGGISINIDPLSGAFAESATAEHGGGHIPCHPDTGYIFKENYIENWVSVKQDIESIANKLIDFNDIALDIAITTTKAIIVEFNFRYGIEHQQCVIGGMRRILNIPNK